MDPLATSFPKLLLRPPHRGPGASASSASETGEVPATEAALRGTAGGREVGRGEGCFGGFGRSFGPIPLGRSEFSTFQDGVEVLRCFFSRFLGRVSRCSMSVEFLGVLGARLLRCFAFLSALDPRTPQLSCPPCRPDLAMRVAPPRPSRPGPGPTW